MIGGRWFFFSSRIECHGFYVFIFDMLPLLFDTMSVA